jgi:hypothetical protein
MSTAAISAATTAGGTVVLFAFLALVVAREARRQVGHRTNAKRAGRTVIVLVGLLAVDVLVRFLTLSHGR